MNVVISFIFLDCLGFFSSFYSEPEWTAWFSLPCFVNEEAGYKNVRLAQGPTLTKASCLDSLSSALPESSEWPFTVVQNRVQGSTDQAEICQPCACVSAHGDGVVFDLSEPLIIISSFSLPGVPVAAEETKLLTWSAGCAPPDKVSPLQQLHIRYSSKFYYPEK
jgi:hypothetical protein